jgi:phage virion morphogenesis protein
MSVYDGAEFKGLNEAVKALDKFADDVAARRGALKGLGTLAESSAKARIVSGGPGPSGDIWAPWSARYQATRKQGFKGGKKTGHSLLRDTSALLASLQFEVVSDDLVQTGSNEEYAGVHQFGSSKASGRGAGIPARTYLGFSESELVEAQSVISGWVEATFETRFGRLA